MSETTFLNKSGHKNLTIYNHNDPRLGSTSQTTFLNNSGHQNLTIYKHNDYRLGSMSLTIFGYLGFLEERKEDGNKEDLEIRTNSP